MWRSEPHTPVASIRTIASSSATSSGSGSSETRTSPGAWKVTARIAAADPTDPARDMVSGVSDLDGRAVLVTGSSSGIGEAVARRLAAVRGLTVYATARRPETLAGLAGAGCKTLA